MRTLLVVAWATAALLLAACPRPTNENDAGVPDAGAPRDAGPHADAAVMLDAAVQDAALPDAATLPDAALPPDAAQIPDAAVTVMDAATPPDAASSNDAAVGTGCVTAQVHSPTTSGTWQDGTLMATATQQGQDDCARTFVLSTNAPLRDALPANPRTVTEIAGRPSLHSGNVMLDALYALALTEAAENSVPAISDGSFSNGQALPCPTGGCFETGRLWHYVWTRDTSYSVHLGLGGLDVVRALNSLMFKVSPRRDGSNRQVVQDTGTGGSYPVSSDRVVWALGAEELLQHLSGTQRDTFRDAALEVLTNTLNHDVTVVQDPSTGLFNGETSFLDWREQTYPPWMMDDPVHIAMSSSLSTNVLHLRALKLVAALATETGDTARATQFGTLATQLQAAIASSFRLDPASPWSTYSTTELDRAPVQRFDLLANALAILSDVTTPQEALAITRSYPHLERGAPVTWPFQKDTAIYHNRAIWPFVTAYWVRAARKAGNDAAVSHGVRSLIRGAALNLSNMEAFEAVTGEPNHADGIYSGPVINSQRQLWSVAGFLSMVQHTLLGLEHAADGLHIHPYVTAELRNTLFSNTDSIVLNGYAWQGKHITVVMDLPAAGGRMDGAYSVAAVTLNGQPLSGAVGVGALALENLVHVTLTENSTPGETITLITNTTEYRNLFGPRPPSITGVSHVGNALRVQFASNGEAASDVTFNIYRDGVRVAADLPGGTVTFDDNSVPALNTRTHCYAVESVFLVGGNHSQHSAPVCFWGDSNQRIQAFAPALLQNVGGNLAADHGKPHWENWGAAGNSLSTPMFTAQQSGVHLVHVVYGNGAGPVSTGITCGLKRVRVLDSVGNSVGQGQSVMPQLGTWDAWRDSSYARATLTQGQTYRVVIDDDVASVNMSAFLHFSTYTGGNGGAAPYAFVNVADVKVLALGQ